MSGILFEHFHGAVTRVGATETAVPHREPGWNLLLPSVWLDPAETDGERRLDARHARAPCASTSTDRRWLNYLADDQGADSVRGAYGQNWDRLVQVKRRVDPDNVFHHNHNIPPG